MTTNTTESLDELIEKLAAIEHERWADWQKWCHRVLRENNPSPEIGDVLERWDRQIETPYSKLSRKEQLSDLEQVDRYWPLIEAYCAEQVRQATIQTAVNIGKQIELELVKKQLSSPPPDGARFLTDQELIAQVVLSYTTKALKETPHE